jgi:hypothetical protein
MAIITPSSLVSEIRGSVGDQTFSRNAYRAYVKERKAPTNPNTLRQIEVRNFMGAASEYWRIISQDQRNAWNSFAKQLNAKSRLGQEPKLNGYNACSRWYITYQLGACEFINEPGPLQVLPIPEVIYSFAAPSLLITGINLEDNPLGVGILVKYSKPVLAGIESINSVELKLIRSTILYSTTGLYFDDAVYEDRFNISIGDFVGYNIWYEVSFCDVKNGRSRVMARDKFEIVS